MSLVTYYSNPNSLVGWDAAQLSAATATIDFAAYSLTEPTLINTLISRARANVKVRLYLDRSEVEAEARGNPAMPSCPLHLLFGEPNVTIRVKASMVLMHLKSYCVDNLKLRDGSANFSPHGEQDQDNSATFTDDTAAISRFRGKFEAMWARPDNLTIAAAVGTGSTFAAVRGNSH